MKKVMTMVGVAGFALAATAGFDDSLLEFSTPGPDKYADGTEVLPGECYALVWTADGQFEGIKGDGTTVDSKDVVVLVAPVAKKGAYGMCCPPLLYQVGKEFVDSHKDGQYAVYILDTRVKAADGSWAVGGVDANGALQAVNGYGAVSAGTDAEEVSKSVAMSSTKTVATTAASGASVATLSKVDAPVITAIKPNGATITISTSNLSPVVTYKVVKGGSGDLSKEKLAEPIEDVEIDSEGNFTFEKPENGTFFKVIGVRKIEEK